ncbi:acyltransferase family protein [Pinibacter aurantiacus]|uniref:Acyltransferase n=1 Tax=Pinibacter aurantiacus TaxID=2851599 RepID=A0A9E2S4W2_9BACT|nr:acyltransferase [Pinibacter aurantiacus]MBV4355662.1 acyltransferase [Pinibacter aurantiacus]
MQKNTHRIEALDSLRGIAALQVLLHHCLLCLPVFYAVFSPKAPLPFSSAENTILNALTYSPLHFFWLGNEPVILFFVLSGFVLSIPFNDGGQHFDYKAYFAKRLIRLYIPYIVSIFLSMLLRVVLYHPLNIHISDWFISMWTKPVSAQQLADIILLKSDAEFQNVVSTLWSLVIEIKLSLIFPLILFFYRRLNFVWSFAVLIGIILTYHLLVKAGLFERFGKSFETFYYLSFFIMGAVLNFFKDYFLRIINGFPAAVIIFITIVALLLSTCSWNIWLLPEHPRNFLIMIANYLIAGAGMLWILLFLSNYYKRVAESAPLKWLGKISFSLYIIHPVCLLIAVYSLRVLPVPVMILAGFVLSFVFASVYYKLVEQPSLIFAKKIADRIKKRKIQGVKS